MAEVKNLSSTKNHHLNQAIDPSAFKFPAFCTSYFNYENLDELTLKKKLEAAYSNIDFLQREHSQTINGLHNEIQKLQYMYTDLQLRCEIQGFLSSDNDSLKCDVPTLELKVNRLVKDNNEMKEKLKECKHTLEVLDQKLKLEKWQYRQELEERDNTILHLQKELEAKCNAVAELSLLIRKKRNNVLHRFAFNTPDVLPMLSSQTKAFSLNHACNRRMCSEPYGLVAHSLPSYESCSNFQYGNSSHSSLSDRSVSDDESLNKTAFLTKHYTFPRSQLGYGKFNRSEHATLQLPPVPGLTSASKRQLVRHQIRLNKIASKDTLAIDQVSLPELIVKRLGKN